MMGWTSRLLVGVTDGVWWDFGSEVGQNVANFGANYRHKSDPEPPSWP